MKNENIYVTPDVVIVALESADVVTASFDGDDHEV